MAEKDDLEKELEAFREKFREGLKVFFELLELDSTPLSPDPSSMGIDERTLDELSVRERLVVRDVVFGELGVTEESIVRKYQTEADLLAKVPGKIDVMVYSTNRDEIYLQELVFSDDEKRWVIGADQNI